MEQKRKDTQGEAMIGKLIAAAGPGETASAEARDRVYAAVQARWQETLKSPARAASRPGFSQLRIFALAASLALAAVTVYWLQPSAPDATAIEGLARFARVEGDAELMHRGESRRLATAADAGTIEAGDRLRTGTDGKLALALGDGISLRMNVDTELAFASASDVELVGGTIYIDSGEAGASSDLEVATPFGRVEHVGTQYEVHMAGPDLRVRVREGAVVFTGQSGEATGAAGEQLDIGAGGLRTRSSFAPDDSAWNWATDLASLPGADDYRLVEVLAWAARESGLVLEFADASTEARLAGESLVGDALSGLNPDETLSVIERTTDLRYQREAGRLIVRD